MSKAVKKARVAKAEVAGTPVVEFQPNEPQEPKRSMPERIDEIEIQDEPYAGMKFTANRNFTIEEMDALISGFFYRTRDALKVLVKGWSEGFLCDREGREVPFSDAAWNKLPVDLVIAMGWALSGATLVPKA